MEETAAGADQEGGSEVLGAGREGLGRRWRAL